MHIEYILSGLSFLTLAIGLDMSYWEAGALSTFIFALFSFLRRLSIKFVFLDIIILIASIQWLLAPVISYHIFNKYNPLAKLWNTYMKIPSDDYFSYVLPGTLLFILGLKFPISTQSIPSATSYINNAKHYLSDKGNASITLVIIGFIFTILQPFSPQIIQAIFSYFSLLTFIGVFYSLYSPYKYKKIIIFSVFTLLVIQCIISGMYGALLFWSILILVVFIIGKKFQFWKKISISLIGLFFIFLIQSIKSEYREKTWDTGMVRSTDASYFGKLIWERISQPSTIFEPERLFGMANRSNQGALIANAMKYVPKHEPFANGETIFMAFISSLVPRIFWPNKPLTGGKEMIVRFLGAPNNLEYSFNISPIGEAYVNFGRMGGIVFMLFYGLFFNYIFIYILKISNSVPSLVFWLPVIFIGPISSMETDVLSAINSLVKALIFTWSIYYIFNTFLKTKI